MEDTILSNSRLTMDNPRFADNVARMVRLMGKKPGVEKEWAAIAAGTTDKDFRAKMNAAINVANNKYKEGRLGLERQRLDIDKASQGGRLGLDRQRLDIGKTNADRDFYLKSRNLKMDNDWKPGAVLGVADIAVKGYFGSETAKRTRQRADRVNLLNEKLFGKER